MANGIKMSSIVGGITFGGIAVLISILWADILGFLNLDPTTLTDQIAQLLFWAGVILIGVLVWALVLRKDPDRKLVVSAIGINLVVLALGVPRLYDALGWNLSELFSNVLSGGLWVGIVLMIIGLTMYIIKAKNK